MRQRRYFSRRSDRGHKSRTIGQCCSLIGSIQWLSWGVFVEFALMLACLDTAAQPPSVPLPAPQNGTTEDFPRPHLDDAQIDAAATIRPLSSTLTWEVAPRGLTLRDAIQCALAKSDVVRTLGSNGVQIESVTEYDPAIRQQQANVAATAFDPKLSAGYVGSRIDEPSGTFFGPGIPQNVRRDEGDFVASVSKQWATGATTSVGYLPPLGYLFYPYGTSGPYNPIYTSDLVIQAQQPLMRGAGWAVNMAPIRIAQLKTEQSAWDFKESVLAQVRSVETAYWDLQAALVTLEALESAIPLMSEVVRIEGHRAKLEMSTAADVARASIQFDAIQQQRIQARNDAIAKELRLRNLMAIELWDGSRIVPTDPPRNTPIRLDHTAAVENALQQRPELVRQRLGVRIREMEYSVAANGVKPQLDLQALYRSNGIGQELNHSLQQMLSFQYSDWTVGATFSIPLGNRAARANLNNAELQLVRDRAVLNQSIQNIGFKLADMIRECDAAFSQFELALNRVQNSREWIRAARIRYSTPPPAEDGNQNWLLLALYDYQNALRMQVDATTDCAQLLARYNTLIARVEETQGVLLAARGIDWPEDPCTMIQARSAEVFGPAALAAKFAPRPVIAPADRHRLPFTGLGTISSEQSPPLPIGHSVMFKETNRPFNQAGTPVSDPTYNYRRPIENRDRPFQDPGTEHSRNSPGPGPGVRQPGRPSIYSRPERGHTIDQR